MSKRIRILLISCAMLLLAVSLVVVAVYTLA